MAFDDLPLILGPVPVASEANVDAASAANAPGGLLVNRRIESRFTASCIAEHCTLVLRGFATEEPILVADGGRSSTGEMDGQIDFGPWFRAKGRVSFERGNRFLVHMQDVGLGQSQALGGRSSIGGIARNTFRYFDTRDARGFSLSAEVGPAFRIHLPASSDVVSMSATAGPDVLFTGQVSGTMNLGMQYTL